MSVKVIVTKEVSLPIDLADVNWDHSDTEITCEVEVEVDLAEIDVVDLLQELDVRDKVPPTLPEIDTGELLEELLSRGANIYEGDLGQVIYVLEEQHYPEPLLQLIRDYWHCPWLCPVLEETCQST